MDAAHVARGLARGKQEGGRGERLFAELAVHPRAVGAEVEHVAEDADQPPGQVGGGVDRQRGGVRVGVIAVVDYREAGRAQHARAVPDRGVFGEAGGYLRVGEAELHAHGGRGEGGVDKVAAEGGDFGAYPPPTPDDVEAHGPFGGDGEALGVHVAAALGAVPEQALPRPQGGELRVVAVQDDEGVGAHLLKQLGLGPEHAVEVAEVVEVRAAYESVHRYVRPRHAPEARHLAEIAYAELHDRGLG